jgi:hypothetical protein
MAQPILLAEGAAEQGILVLRGNLIYLPLVLAAALVVVMGVKVGAHKLLGAQAVPCRGEQAVRAQVTLLTVQAAVLVAGEVEGAPLLRYNQYH